MDILYLKDPTPSPRDARPRWAFIPRRRGRVLRAPPASAGAQLLADPRLGKLDEHLLGEVRLRVVLDAVVLAL